MTTELFREVIEASALGIEILAVAVIVVSISFGTVRFLLHVQRQKNDAYDGYKIFLGKSLLLGLEFLVAADIIRTVALDPTLNNVLLLALLVVVRTFLSWALVVEMEGRWPWTAAAAEKRESESVAAASTFR
ncbi:MAG TPA: DUF1622 domain-containing protein [Vicinamibacterales bacterium]|nr:DUF1622 domain-containing protein [Vicinamibacterales bacterium]